MAERTAELQTINARLETEQRVLEERLRRAGKAAKAANLAKSTFLANMSHEVRTQLNTDLLTTF